MKTIFSLTFFVSALLFTSCSSDDSGEDITVGNYIFNTKDVELSGTDIDGADLNLTWVLDGESGDGYTYVDIDTELIDRSTGDDYDGSYSSYGFEDLSIDDFPNGVYDISIYYYSWETTTRGDVELTLTLTVGTDQEEFTISIDEADVASYDEAKYSLVISGAEYYVLKAEDIESVVQ